MDTIIQKITDKKVLKTIEANVNPDEEIFVQIEGASKQTLVATNKKLLIIKPGFMAGTAFGAKVTQYSYQQISSLEVKFGLLTGVFEVSAGGMQGNEKSFWGTDKDSDAYKAPNCIPLNKTMRKDFESAIRIIHELMDQGKATKSGSESSDITDKIRKLANLHDEGLLTDEEFQSKKEELLKLM